MVLQIYGKNFLWGVLQNHEAQQKRCEASSSLENGTSVMIAAHLHWLCQGRGQLA